MPYYFSGRLSQHLLWLACAAGVVGLLASRALVALAPVVGVCAVLANPNVRREAGLYFRNGAAMRAAALFGFLLVSGLYTSEWATWRHELFRSLTWLGVPLAFTLAVPLAGGQRRAVGALFVLGTAAVGLATSAQYLLDPGSANAAISVGQNMQSITGVFHIYFGVMLALSFFWGLRLRQHPEARLWWRGALLGAAAAAALTLHLLAYRTGLLVFYAGLLGYVGWLLTQKRLVMSLGILVLLALGPLLAYSTLESVRHRVGSTLWDLNQYRTGQDLNDYSLSKRLVAAETAVIIIRQHWLLGVGPADAHAVMREQYDWRDYGLRDASQADVHNQYLNALLGGGLVGLVLWLAVLFWPLTRRWARTNPDLCFFILIQATGMLVTDTLSLQIGLNMFVFGYGFLVVAGEAREQRKLLVAGC
ncbi:O-antigen ligase family protein [Hymenobacter sp. IS2118]|uniref:O-antigen ligase family protein n=1 Tax=Hymenobacter sp. IS2118 TaxID=1505605 RepID=UPI0013780707|nr:O-antigen ligase family protein [Hymenobacter sp. IS2118]